ncbi:histone PARylation factor 1-like [Toxorhynchites rutilus septentrionalis]|uniref:histone PARylation factor 1-like n=1 Tax=Toxorhynchites rutilus septentrionalis TaxID=329112 RepID=UPI002479FE18|nr:histone PARylation factor 1-like [Toxorhynchites rutilus septentrionalis]
MDKPDCKYGLECYQKNPAHKEKYRHPEKPTASETTDKTKTDSTSPKKNDASAASKHRSASPDSSDVFESIKKCKRPPTPEKDHNNDEEKDESNQYYGMTRQRYTLPEVPMDAGMMSDIYDPQIEFSKKAEYKELCEDPKQFIKHKFLVDMPSCFESLWKFCVSKSGEKPEDVFDKFGLRLIGPFDVLAKKFEHAKMHEPGDYLRHWRFYYDPPEFQTVFVKKGTGVHYGYWRDQPDDTSGLMAVNDANKGCEFKLIGENAFDAVIHFLENEVVTTPFNKSQITSMKRSLEEWAKDHNIGLKGGDKLKARGKTVVCKTFHKAGIVVPFDRKKEVGYRELLESDANLKKILAKFDTIDNAPDKIEFDAAMSQLQPIVTAAFIAVDECDFGTALELAIDLFCHGTENLHKVAKPLFVTAYSMLQRPQFIAIMKSHLEDRRKGIDLDLLTK